jgi:hypothetical protein
VRLVFDRQETSGCSEEVVFGDFGIRRYLPAHQQTVVEVTPPAPGTYEFTCGMGMLRGARRRSSSPSDRLLPAHRDPIMTTANITHPGPAAPRPTPRRPPRRSSSP